MKRFFISRLILKINQWFFFRKIRKIDLENLVKYQKFQEKNPRSSFSLKQGVLNDFEK